MAGMKHTDVAPGRADQACGEIQRMSADEVERTLEFIAAISAERGGVEAPGGYPRKLIEHQGTWSFNEGERQKLLDELAQMRKGGRQ